MVMENRVPTYSTLVDFMGVEHLNIQHRDFIQAYFPCGKIRRNPRSDILAIAGVSDLFPTFAFPLQPKFKIIGEQHIGMWCIPTFLGIFCGGCGDALFYTMHFFSGAGRANHRLEQRLGLSCIAVSGQPRTQRFAVSFSFFIRGQIQNHIIESVFLRKIACNFRFHCVAPFRLSNGIDGIYMIADICLLLHTVGCRIDSVAIFGCFVLQKANYVYLGDAVTAPNAKCLDFPCIQHTICRFLTHGPRTAQHLAKLWYVHYIGVFSENFSLSKWFSHNRQLLSKIIADLIPQAWRSPVENK